MSINVNSSCYPKTYIIKLLLVFLLTTTFAGSALAQISESPKVVDNRKDGIIIVADSLEVDKKQLKAVFTGSVSARQKGRELKANRLEVFYVDQDGKMSPTIIKGYGDVYFFGKDLIAENADTGTFDVRAQKIKLAGNLKLLQGENIIYGKEASIDLNTGKAEINKGEEKNGRVRGTFNFANN